MYKSDDFEKNLEEQEENQKIEKIDFIIAIEKNVIIMFIVLFVVILYIFNEEKVEKLAKRVIGPNGDADNNIVNSKSISFDLAIIEANLCAQLSNQSLVDYLSDPLNAKTFREKNYIDKIKIDKKNGTITFWCEGTKYITDLKGNFIKKVH